jgi:hypothetical protein
MAVAGAAPVVTHLLSGLTTPRPTSWWLPPAVAVAVVSLTTARLVVLAVLVLRRG